MDRDTEWTCLQPGNRKSWTNIRACISGTVYFSYKRLIRLNAARSKVLFTVEMLLKIVSKGFILHRYAYLRDVWNWIDFLVVILGWLGMIPNMGNFTALRTIRVLRPLRTMSRIPGKGVDTCNGSGTNYVEITHQSILSVSPFRLFFSRNETPNLSTTFSDEAFARCAHFICFCFPHLWHFRCATHRWRLSR